MRVTVVGAGYVGLVTAACLADKQHEVVCVDVDPDKVETIRRGESPIHEQGLGDLLRRNVGVRLYPTTDLQQAVHQSEMTLIAVGTPFDGQQIDLGQVKAAATGIGKALGDKHDYHVVAVKSTVVPGTTDEVVTPILEEVSGKKAGADFGVAMNPEFLTEGQAVDDFMAPDRLVLGGRDGPSVEALEALYIPFPGVPRVRTNNRTAEMIKYSSNALLATAISFSNEIANLCSAVGGVDVAEVLRALHLSHYLSPAVAGHERVLAPIAAFLWAGCGFGGSCLPKDVRALIAHGTKLGAPMDLLDAVIRINQRQPGRLVARIKRHFPSLRGVRVALLGLAFRPETADMRESPAIPIVAELISQGAEIRAYDPAAKQEATKLFAGQPVILCDGLEEAIEAADVIVLVTRWIEFSRLPNLLAGRSNQPLVIDGRRMLDKTMLARYDGIGL